METSSSNIKKIQGTETLKKIPYFSGNAENKKASYISSNVTFQSTTKKWLQRLPIPPTQVKAGNTSENLLNKIRQIIYFLFWEKEITKKLYNNIMSSIKL